MPAMGPLIAAIDRLRRGEQVGERPVEVGVRRHGG